MMPMSSDQWQRVISELSVGQKVSCYVVEHHPWGVLLRIESCHGVGLIERIVLGKRGYCTPEDYPPVGSLVVATVLGFRDQTCQVELDPPAPDEKSPGWSTSRVVRNVELRRDAGGRLLSEGISVVNQMISDGFRISRLSDMSVICEKVNSNADFVEMKISGFSMKIEMYHWDSADAPLA